MEDFRKHPLNHPPNGSANNGGPRQAGEKDLQKLIEDGLRVALVQDALPFIGGAEKLLQAAWELFPQAPLYTLVYNREAFAGTSFAEKRVHTSFLDRLPGARRSHRSYLPLYPLAIERLDLRDYDLVLSFSYAVAHGVLVRPDQLHVSLVHTPLRYAWHFYHQYLNEAGLRSGLRGWLAQLALHYLRLWDRSAANRTDSFVAISGWVARCLWRAYRRQAKVIYPPVEVERFRPLPPRENYYVAISRLTLPKKVALMVEAFTQLKLPLLVIGEGPERNRLARIAGPDVKLLGWQPDSVVQELLGKAKGFVHAAEEDFGIALVEAQAAGCPVIAYGSGGAAESVLHGETGLLYPNQNAAALCAAVEAYESGSYSFDPADLQANARRFSRERFQQALADHLVREWGLFNQQFNKHGSKEQAGLRLSA